MLHVVVDQIRRPGDLLSSLAAVPWPWPFPCNTNSLLQRKGACLLRFRRYQAGLQPSCAVAQGLGRYPLLAAGLRGRALAPPEPGRFRPVSASPKTLRGLRDLIRVLLPAVEELVKLLRSAASGAFAEFPE